MGLLNRIASWINTEVLPARLPQRTVFQGWVQQLASHFGARISWDEDGDAVLIFQVSREDRAVFLILDDGEVYVAVPSGVNFPPGRLPGDVAAFLMERNQKLDYADWDARDTDQRSYFTLKAHGRMDRIDPGLLREVIEKMLVESIALDRTLQEQGYVR